jgi:uncharacterized protein (DUF952 family)
LGEAAGTVVMIYKICDRAAWDAAARAGVYRGSEVDARDGFIHFSAAAQLGETAARHFADLFPHLYATLPVAAVRWTRALADEVNGVRRLPELNP